MSDDNVIKLPTAAFAKFQEAIASPAEPTPALVALMAEPSVFEPSANPLGFTDLDAAFNMRDWLKKALVAAGAKSTGAGMGFGAADVDIELEGHDYVVSIKPISRSASTSDGEAVAESVTSNSERGS